MAYSVIKKPSDYFNTKLYTGNGTTNAITGVGFQPDFIWCKARSIAYDHRVFNSISGVEKYLDTGNTGAESSDANSITAFGTDGFTLGSEAGGNVSGQTFASWNWLASNTTAANTDGSISSTVSANTTSGFSIVSYTGTGSNATVGHGLGSTPKMIIVKRRNNVDGWQVYNHLLVAGNYLRLDGTHASSTDATRFTTTSPTSSVFSVGTAPSTNASGDTYIAYCFADVQGYSKFGSYIGNGNADGTFVYTGFKPAFVLVKISSGIDDWQILDNKRDTYNVTSKYLRPNSSGIEITNDVVDFLSNGFKLRTSAGSWNPSGGSFIYMCFAEQPLVGDNPATAR